MQSKEIVSNFREEFSRERKKFQLAISRETCDDGSESFKIIEPCLNGNKSEKKCQKFDLVGKSLQTFFTCVKRNKSVRTCYELNELDPK